MVKAALTPSFIVARSEFLFQFLVVPLDDPAVLGQAHQIGEFGSGGRVDSQYRLRSTSALGYSISNRSSERSTGNSKT
jgi:hypothetical protein